MAMINVTPEELRSSANRINTNKNAMSDTLKQISKIVEETIGPAGTWIGKGPEALYARYKATESGFEEFDTALVGFVNNLNTTAAGFEESDAAIASNV